MGSKEGAPGGGSKSPESEPGLSGSSPADAHRCIRLNLLDDVFMDELTPEQAAQLRGEAVFDQGPSPSLIRQCGKCTVRIVSNIDSTGRLTAEPWPAGQDSIDDCIELYS